MNIRKILSAFASLALFAASILSPVASAFAVERDSTISESNSAAKAESTPAANPITVNVYSGKLSSASVYFSGTIPSSQVNFSIRDFDPSDSEIVNFQRAAASYSVSAYLDLSLTDAEGQPIHSLSAPATVTLQLKNPLSANDVSLIHYKNDGTFESIPAEYESDSLVFQTDSFSYYAIAVRSVSMPNTGDVVSSAASANTSLSLLSVILIASIFGYVYIRNKRNAQE